MKIFVTRKVPLWEEISKPLYDAGHTVVVYPNNHRIERKELEIELEKGYDALLCLLTEKIDAELLEHDKKIQLKIVANYAVGFDNIDLTACSARNIVVTNTPADAVNESVAEFAITLMLNLAKDFMPAFEFAKNAAYKGWEPDVFLGVNLTGKTLGVIGAGKIGTMVAARATGFGMKVLAYSRSSGLKLEDVLTQSDVVTLHVPLTPETRQMMNAKTFAQMKQGAFLINTARGPVVDEADLVQALVSGHLGGASLDVWENEPTARPELLEMDNVILTPHVASATYEARRAMGIAAVENIAKCLRGEVPPNRV